ncbi:MAG: PDZ domain-containing protein [Acidimicrobiia bacterium]|nr:PDZ domain-containing protein [Acidimicrobiia bacterium]
MLDAPLRDRVRPAEFVRSLVPLVALVLLGLGLANVSARATFQEVEDGVLWVAGAEGVAAVEVAEGSPGAGAGVAAGDLLLSIDDRPVRALEDVVVALHDARVGQTLRYTVWRANAREVIEVRVAPIPSGSVAIYFFLAAVGIFSLLVGTAVRVRRPRDPATLHFFWLSLAFFGVFTFSFSGRLDRLDWFFYWADRVALLLLPPLFLHFSLVFPDRPERRRARPGWLVPLVYVPAVLLGIVRAGVLGGWADTAGQFSSSVALLDRLQYLYLALGLVGGLAVLVRALRGAHSITARRQLRWIAWGTALGGTPFALAYALPFAAGAEPSLLTELSVIPLGVVPLAYACAIVRYRLMDVEVIVKRALVYVAALSAIVLIYVALLQALDRVYVGGDAQHNWIIALLATLVAVLLAPPVKEAVQTGLDRLFYRDRYDYRRALVGFARDLNRDLDLHRLSERLVTRITETLLVDRMALMLASDGDAGRFTVLGKVGFGEGGPPALEAGTGIGKRLCEGQVVALDDPLAVGRYAVEEIEYWRDAGLYYFVPCVANEGTIAVLALGWKESAEPLTSEDTALLAAVAGQVATALENARLYHQLRVKAAELDRLREFNENIVESLDDGLLVFDLDDRVVRWNGVLERIYGVPRAEAIGRRIDALFDAPFLDAVRAALRASPAGTTLSRVPLVVRQAGTPGAPGRLLVNVTAAPLRSGEGTDALRLGTIVMIQNVTARVQLEEQLQISEKMASIGVLAAGVAHEVNTPLTGISSFAQLLLKDADPGDPRTDLLEKIERQTFRAAKIVNSLLNLSRQSTSTPERVPVDLNVVVGDVLSLLEHQFGAARIKVRRENGDRVARIAGVEHALQQVFLNLFLNARDAMPRGGWLSVSVRRDAGRVIAEVADTGSGIPPEHLARIYDPFFTTKTGQGTGLGLSITYGIVREHDGSLTCDSTPGKGTRFTLTFPEAAAVEPQTARAN